MKILITNDDGMDAEGIRLLTEAMTGLGEVMVAAPAKNHSGASSALTLTGEIAVQHEGAEKWRIYGTPSDCVHLALTGDFLPAKPDLIVSGINSGANMGDDTIYSGTVAAVIEGHLFGVPGMAFSMAGKSECNYAAGAQAARVLVSQFLQKKFLGLPLLNVNIPDLSTWRGFAATRLGRRHAAEPALRCGAAENGTISFVIGEAGEARDHGEGTDFYAVEHGLVSVTPLMVDLTDASQISRTHEWLPS